GGRPRQELGRELHPRAQARRARRPRLLARLLRRPGAQGPDAGTRTRGERRHSCRGGAPGLTALRRGEPEGARYPRQLWPPETPRALRPDAQPTGRRRYWPDGRPRTLP